MIGALTKIDCTLCENEFGRYCVPQSSQHRPAPQEVLRGGVWERETVEFMRGHASARDIVHAGMFFGDFLPGLSSALSPGRTIYGFEPNPENFIAAQWTTALNALANVKLFNAGLGAKQSRALLRTVSADGKAIGGLSHVTGQTGAGVSEIDLLTVDEAVPSTADVGVIQFDVEGYEENALRGSINTIRRCLPIIVLETVPEAFVGEYLAPLGYSLHGTVCANSIFRP